MVNDSMKDRIEQEILRIFLWKLGRNNRIILGIIIKRVVFRLRYESPLDYDLGKLSGNE